MSDKYLKTGLQTGASRSISSIRPTVNIERRIIQEPLPPSGAIEKYLGVFRAANTNGDGILSRKELSTHGALATKKALSATQIPDGDPLEDLRLTMKLQQHFGRLKGVTSSGITRRELFETAGLDGNSGNISDADLSHQKIRKALSATR